MSVVGFVLVDLYNLNNANAGQIVFGVKAEQRRLINPPHLQGAG